MPDDLADAFRDMDARIEQRADRMRGVHNPLSFYRDLEEESDAYDRPEVWWQWLLLVLVLLGLTVALVRHWPAEVEPLPAEKVE